MINRVKDHKGNLRIQLSKYWPDGSRFKRYMPNPTVAKKTQSRIDEAIAMGTWRELKEELYGGSKEDLTVEQFSKIYLDEYCKVHNRRPDFKEETLQTIVAIVGSVRVKDFSRSHAHYFIKQRSKTVKGATVNRGLAVIKNMLTFAIEKEIIDVHPLARFHMLPEEEVALRIPTLEEERRLVAAVMKENPTIGAYVGILGETGARMQEGLRLQWPLVNLNQRLLTIEETKNGKVRHIPLSDYAIELLRTLTRIVGCPYVFACLDTMDRYREPRGPFETGRKKAGLEWVGFHDLRHFRASQWIMKGVDPRTVQELMGHRDIKTTMRYAHFAPQHASRSILEAQNREAAELAELQAKNRTKESGDLVGTQHEIGNCLM